MENLDKYVKPIVEALVQAEWARANDDAQGAYNAAFTAHSLLYNPQNLATDSECFTKHNVEHPAARDAREIEEESERRLEEAAQAEAERRRVEINRRATEKLESYGASATA